MVKQLFVQINLLFGDFIFFLFAPLFVLVVMLQNTIHVLVDLIKYAEYCLSRQQIDERTRAINVCNSRVVPYRMLMIPIIIMTMMMIKEMRCVGVR